jgi:hypothetical protein
MADKKTEDYYISWKHEKKRAYKLGKNTYAGNCDIEINRLEKENPELKTKECNCIECK